MEKEFSALKELVLKLEKRDEEKTKQIEKLFEEIKILKFSFKENNPNKIDEITPIMVEIFESKPIVYKKIQEMPNLHMDQVWRSKTACNDKYAISVSLDGSISTYSLKDKKLAFQKLHVSSSDLNTISILEKSSSNPKCYAFVGGNDKSLYQIDIEANKVIKNWSSISPNKETVESSKISHNQLLLATGHRTHIKLWNLKEKK